MVAALSIDDDYVLEIRQLLTRLVEAVEVRALDDRDPAARIGDDVLDLLRGERLVDRERHAAQRNGCQVGRDELPAVTEHEGDRVPLLHAELGEATGDPVDAIAQLVPGQVHPTGLVADREVVAQPLHLLVEGLEQVLSGQPRRRAPAGRPL